MLKLFRTTLAHAIKTIARTFVVGARKQSVASRYRATTEAMKPLQQSGRSAMVAQSNPGSVLPRSAAIVACRFDIVVRKRLNLNSKR